VLGVTVPLDMKAIRYLPLVYIIGVHGFVVFAPYMVLVLATVYAARCFKRTNLIPAPITAREPHEWIPLGRD
jgi:hypothetical protein